MTQANDERAARKEYIRRRQKTVFSIVGAVMVVAMVVSLLFFFHVGGLGNVKSAAVQPNYGQQAPCPIKEADGNKAKYVENRNITLRVLNGTKFSGFAKAVSDALQNREFNPQTPGNYTKKVDRTMIVFGKNGVNQAYTVAFHRCHAGYGRPSGPADRRHRGRHIRQSAGYEEGSRRRQGDHRHPGLRRGGQDDRPAQGARA